MRVLNLNSPVEHLLYSIYGVILMAVCNIFFEPFLSAPFGIMDVNSFKPIAISLGFAVFGTSSLFVRVLPFSWGRLFLHIYRILFLYILLAGHKTQFAYYFCMNEYILDIWIKFGSKSLSFNKIVYSLDNYSNVLKIADHECRGTFVIFVMAMAVMYLVFQSCIVWRNQEKYIDRESTGDVNVDFLSRER